MSCKGVKLKKESSFTCDCGTSYTTGRHLLQKHIDGVHRWEPTRCTIPGCTSDKIFAKREALQQHNRQNPIEPPIRFMYPGCNSTTVSDRIAYEWSTLHPHLTRMLKATVMTPMEERSTSVANAFPATALKIARELSTSLTYNRNMSSHSVSHGMLRTRCR
jgi:hypothetical protein